MNISVCFGLFLLVCSAITICLWVIYIKCCNKEEKETVTFGVVLMFMSMLTASAFTFAFSDKPITPIDVYRGKTTLEITYKDSIAIDSVVVWKKEEK